MLKIIKYSDKKTVEKKFDNISIFESSWIIPNLKTKNELQKKILQKSDFYINTTVMRIRDLWTHIFNSELPEYKIISNETYQILVKNILNQYKEQIDIDLVDYEKKCRDLNYFSNLILDNSFDLKSERFQDWLSVSERRNFKLKSELLVNKLITDILL
ncbi:MAG: hypothetical protein KDD45_00815 [Bdellovibrionales bacterium]|nr:hypothetical protein [Bdellovibrionales bacterium]